MINILRTVFLIWFSYLGIAGAETILTVDKVREMALQYNRQYLGAMQELDRAHGTIISARAGALPQLSLSGRYSRNLKARSLFFAGQQIPISLNNEFEVSASLTQPLYVGGKVGSALAIAKIYERYSHEKL